MENDIKLLSSEKETVENERDNLKMTVADMEEEREVLSNKLKDTVDKYTFLSSELEKARLAEKEVQTLLAENQKLKNDKLILSSESEPESTSANFGCRLLQIEGKYLRNQS
jgi:hypothetical protein